MEKYGVPGAPYTDWKNVYVREPTADSERWRSRFRTQGDHRSEVMSITIPA